MISDWQKNFRYKAPCTQAFIFLKKNVYTFYTFEDLPLVRVIW